MKEMKKTCRKLPYAIYGDYYFCLLKMEELYRIETIAASFGFFVPNRGFAPHVFLFFIN